MPNADAHQVMLMHGTSYPLRPPSTQSVDQQSVASLLLILATRLTGRAEVTSIWS